jgi:hypothetical protein
MDVSSVFLVKIAKTTFQKTRQPAAWQYWGVFHQAMFRRAGAALLLLLFFPYLCTA